MEHLVCVRGRGKGNVGTKVRLMRSDEPNGVGADCSLRNNNHTNTLECVSVCEVIVVNNGRPEGIRLSAAPNLN